MKSIGKKRASSATIYSTSGAKNYTIQSHPNANAQPPQNKTSSAVQLKHIPTGIVLKVQETRSRTQNRKIAREMLALKLEQLEKGDKSRVAVVAASKQKKKSSASKKSRRKYKALEAAKAGASGDAPADEGDEASGEAGETDDFESTPGPSTPAGGQQ